MAVQQNEGTRSNAYCSDGGAQSETVAQPKERYSFGSGHDHTPKARKPYKITKQREKWTEEEHQKFLEALKLYGRGWHQIQSQIGTKTAVQIRSHAQKFFSKVVRASSCSTESSLEPVEIPPPRPKRKPSHPYPRNSVDSLKRISVSDQSERSASPNLSVAEKETQSPTSVGSEASGSAVSEQHNSCPSPTSCTTETHSTSLSPFEKENKHMTYSSVEEEKGYLSSVQRPADSTLENFLSVKFESGSNDSVSTKGDAAIGTPITSIKLFGRTLSIADCQKSSSPDTENFNSPTSKTSQENLDVDMEMLVQTLPSDQLHTYLSPGILNCNWNLLPCRAPVKGITNSAELNPHTPLPGWTLYQDPPFYYLQSNNQTSVQILANSCTGLNAGSVSEVENGKKNSDPVDDSQCQQPCHKGRISPCNTMKGFVPYKRCLADRDTNSSMIVLEESKGKRARVCL